MSINQYKYILIMCQTTTFLSFLKTVISKQHLDSARYAQVDYENVTYECGDAPDFDKSCWLDVKFNLGLEFPNLPYLVDGEFKISQTAAIMK